MLLKSMTAGIVGTALLTSVAFAQTPSTTTTTDRTSAAPAMASESMANKGQWRTSKLVGLNVYNEANEKLGDINELLIDQSGKIQAVVIGVGGFLGMGENDVAIAFDKIKFVNEPVAYAAGTGPNATGTRPAGSTANNAATTTTPMTPTTTTGAATGTATANRSNANPWYPDHAMLSATKDQLKSMTPFKYSN